ncbi:MAG: Ig-like domain-containing protein [Paludibacteraceae bacterium]|nr:Ig-like domain-containing protein [Paludibacteraceae bacterium]
MKKITLFLFALMVSVMSFAASIGAPASIDFGEQNIYDKEYLYDSLEIVLSPSGISSGGIYLEIKNDAEGVFDISHSWIYSNGRSDYHGTEYAKVYFYALETGTYTATLLLGAADTYDAVTDSYEIYQNVQLKVVVVNNKPIVTTYEKVTAASQLAEGDVIVLASQATPAVCGPLSSTALPFVTENVTYDASAKTINAPASAQTFTLSKSSGNWQLTKTGSTQRLTMHIYTSGTKEMVELAYDGASVDGYYYTWNISFDSNGDAIVARAGDTDYYIMINNLPSLGGNVFKPYNSNKTVYTTPYQIYKKKSSAGAVSKMDVSPTSVDFGEVELAETKSVDITYTAEYLLADIEWKLEGTNPEYFGITKASGNDRKAGKVTVTYEGLGDVTGSKSATLTYKTKDSDDKELKGSIPLTINLVANTIHPTGLAFAESSPQDLVVGKTLQLTPVFTPSTTTNQQVTWVSNKPTIASVSESGLVTALEYNQYNNNVTITATSVKDPSISAQITINVIQPAVTEVQLNQSEISLYIGATETLTATILPEGSYQKVTWSSADKKIATVSDGKVTAVALGDVEIKATSNANSEKYAVCTVHVIKTPVESIAFNPTTVSVSVNGTHTLAPVVLPAQAAKDNEVAYSGYDDEVIAITDGVVSGLKEGETTITATCGGKTATLTVTVSATPVFSFVTNPANLSDKDTIILGNSTTPVIAGAYDKSNKKLTPLTSGLTFADGSAFAETAQRLVLVETETDGQFQLMIDGTNTYLGNTTNKADLVTTANLDWEFVADGSNGVYVNNVANNRYIGLNGNFIRTYGGTYTKLYVYVRKYSGPATGVESIQPSTISIQKVLRDGQLYLMYNGTMYNVQGQKIGNW